MAIRIRSNHIVPTDNAVGYNISFGGSSGKTASLVFETPSSGSNTHAIEFKTSSGISTQAGGTLTITKKIAIKDDGGNTIYIAAGTIA